MDVKEYAARIPGMSQLLGPAATPVTSLSELTLSMVARHRWWPAS
jgi:hypothetical protein